IPKTVVVVTHKTDNANGRRGETHKSEPFIAKKEVKFPLDNKKEKQDQRDYQKSHLQKWCGVMTSFILLRDPQMNQKEKRKRNYLSPSVAVK
ncbi:unnamed protein product, partial [Brassica rapa subsp. trilocularis]